MVRLLVSAVVVPVALFTVFQLGMGLVHLFGHVATALHTVPAA